MRMATRHNTKNIVNTSRDIQEAIIVLVITAPLIFGIFQLAISKI